jgi:hypothetical protein
VPPPKVFDWRQVESEDYRDCTANLRKIGCPEETIHDVVRADLLQAFTGKRAEVMAARYRDFKYWKTDPDEVAIRGAAEQQRAAVDQELRGALRNLLGEDLVPAHPRTSGGVWSGTNNWRFFRRTNARKPRRCCCATRTLAPKSAAWPTAITRRKARTNAAVSWRLTSASARDSPRCSRRRNTNNST